jgi:predicted enzyme related to lactoylglutathione lyase
VPEDAKARMHTQEDAMDETKDWARPIVHWEIMARDREKIRAFYSAMFNWEISENALAVIPAGIGAPDADQFTGHIFPGAESHVVFYIQVRELRASMQQAEDLGGAVLAQPFDVPNGPTIARIADPEGNPIVLVQQ